MRILIAPNTAVADQILECLESWSAAGLLDPFCWWQADHGIDPASPQDVTLVASGSRSKLRLAQALAGEDLAQVAVMALYPAEKINDGPQAAGEFRAAAAMLLRAATDVLPFRTGEALGASLVAIPAAIGAPVVPGLFGPDWNANVYVAPEDRADPEAANNLSRFPAHAAHAVAVLGDLWLRGEDGEGQLLQQVAAMGAGPDRSGVRAVRCFSRAVEFGYVPSHLAAFVFRPIDGWPNPDIERFDRRQDVRELVDYVVKRFLEKHQRILGLSEIDYIPMPAPRELTLWDAIKQLFRALLFRWREKPIQIIQDAVFDTYNRVAERVERAGGPDRDWNVKRLGHDQVTLDDLRDIGDTLDRPAVVKDGPVEQAWTDLRLLSLGLIDGSELPSNLDADVLIQNNKRAVMTQPPTIVPDPERHPPASAELPDPRACDPLNLDPRFVPAPEPETDSEAGGPAAARVDRTFWSAGHVGTPVWEIGAFIATGIVEARRVAQGPGPMTPQQRLEQERRFEVEEKRKRRSERRRARLLFVFTLLLAGAGGYEAWTHFGWIPRLAALLAIVVIWCLLMGHVARSILRRRDSAALDVVRRTIDQLNAALERAYRRSDEIRLTRRYREYLDWAEIAGWLAHHPWVGEPLKRVPIQGGVDDSTLPSAFRVASARTREKLPVLAKQAQGRIFRPGWLAGLYISVETSLMTAWATFHGHGTGAEDRPNPAADIDEDPESPRKYLRNGVRVGRGRRLSENPLSKNLLRVIDDAPVDAVADSVLLAGGPADADDSAAATLSPSLAWFAEPEGLAELAESVRHAVVKITATDGAEKAWGGSGVVISEAGLIATARHVVEGARQITVSFIDGPDAQATVTRVAPLTDLALITVHDQQVEPVALAPLGRLRQGDPVITLGHPNLQQGEPSLAWGIVTATDRRITLSDPPKGVGLIDVIQATYKSAGGASGSPVFALEGKLVGIHVAGTHEQGSAIPAYLASAIPMSQLRRLLEESGTAPLVASADGDEFPDDAGDGARRTQNLHGFLTEIDGAADGLSLLPQHWHDPLQAYHVVERVLRGGPVDEPSGTMSRLTGPAAFDLPLKAVLSRVDVSCAAEPKELASCEPEDPGEEDTADDSPLDVLG